MNECIFCKIVEGTIPSHKIFEDALTLVFLDIHPVSVGHALVIPKTHSEDLRMASAQDAAAIMQTIQRVSHALLAGVDADGLNIGSNCGASAGQDVFHTHIHLMPRQTGTPRTFTPLAMTQDELAATAQNIRAKL